MLNVVKDARMPPPPTMSNACLFGAICSGGGIRAVPALPFADTEAM